MTLYKLTSLIGVIISILILVLAVIDYKKKIEAVKLGLKANNEYVLSLFLSVLLAVYFIVFSKFFSLSINISFLVIFAAYSFILIPIESFFKIDVDITTGKFLEEGEVVLKKIAAKYKKSQMNILLTNRYVRIINRDMCITINYEDIFFVGMTEIRTLITPILNTNNYMILIRTDDEKFVLRPNQLHIPEVYFNFIDLLKEHIYDYDYKVKKRLRDKYKV